MGRFLLGLIILLSAPFALALSTAEYIESAVLIQDAIHSQFLTAYTIMSASFVAFYFLAWESKLNMFVKGFAGLLIFILLHSTSSSVTILAAMNIDLQFTWVAESGCDDSVISEHRKAFNFDDNYPMFFSCDEPISESYKRYQEWWPRENLYGSTILMTPPDPARNSNPFRAFFVWLFTPLMLIPIFTSVGIWFFCPSKEFFRRKGWINE